MSASYERRIVDITAETLSRPPDGADLHTLRLALDLQVDAMLLALGAAARSGDEAHIPWRRWVVEDLEASRLLARTILEHEAEPPAMMGTGRLGGCGDDALDDLIARYTSMDDLLTSVLRRPYEGQEWRPAAREALERCRSRLEELHTHRGAVAVRNGDRGRGYLPGELLG